VPQISGAATFESLLLVATAADSCSLPRACLEPSRGGAVVVPSLERQHGARLPVVISQDLVECFVQVCDGLAAASSLAFCNKHSRRAAAAAGAPAAAAAATAATRKATPAATTPVGMAAAVSPGVF